MQKKKNYKRQNDPLAQNEDQKSSDEKYIEFEKISQLTQKKANEYLEKLNLESFFFNAPNFNILAYKNLEKLHNSNSKYYSLHIKTPQAKEIGKIVIDKSTACELIKEFLGVKEGNANIDQISPIEKSILRALLGNFLFHFQEACSMEFLSLGDDFTSPSDKRFLPEDQFFLIHSKIDTIKTKGDFFINVHLDYLNETFDKKLQKTKEKITPIPRSEEEWKDALQKSICELTLDLSAIIFKKQKKVLQISSLKQGDIIHIGNSPQISIELTYKKRVLVSGVACKKNEDIGVLVEKIKTTKSN